MRVALFVDALDQRIAVSSLVAEFLLNAEKLVVFGHTVRAACGTGLYLACVRSHCDVSDCGVLCLT